MKKNRVYGAVGIRSNQSNWNADFDGRPKTLTNGSIFGSDKAFKYPMKTSWRDKGLNVMYIKTYKSQKGVVAPKSLKERYEDIFGKMDKNPKSEEVLKNLFECVDVMNFGATFAENKTNLSITGAVQIGQGMNLYEDSVIEVQDILSPFRNSKNDTGEKEDGNSTIGTKIMTDEAHYCYPFSLNPNAYDVYKDIVKDFKGYSKDAYALLKEGMISSTTQFATNSKFGCDNEYALFIEMKEDIKSYLPNLTNYIKLYKEENKIILDLDKLKNLLVDIEDIDSIEFYYDELNLELRGIDELKDKMKIYNIFTKKEVI